MTRTHIIVADRLPTKIAKDSKFRRRVCGATGTQRPTARLAAREDVRLAEKYRARERRVLIPEIAVERESHTLPGVFSDRSERQKLNW
jgi:hypothetical protein